MKHPPGDPTDLDKRRKPGRAPPFISMTRQRRHHRAALIGKECTESVAPHGARAHTGRRVCYPLRLRVRAVSKVGG
jgi:hypothetical protein